MNGGGISVSVVIPTYNRMNMVGEAIDSALAQTYPAMEIIVVDDGSKDDTRQFLERYSGRIKYVLQENQGVSAARNTGIREAKGDVIAFLDSDDAWHPRKIELQVKYLEAHPDIGLIGTKTFSDTTKNWSTITKTAETLAESISFEDVVIATPFSTSTTIVRKTCFESVGNFKTGLRNAEDRDLYIRVASGSGVVRLDANLVWSGRDGEHLSKGSLLAEQTTLNMIKNVFIHIESLRGRTLLRQRAISQVAYEASKMYQSNGDLSRALTRVLRSLILWPLPFPRFEPVRPMPRLMTLTVVVLQILRLKRHPVAAPASRA